VDRIPLYRAWFGDPDSPHPPLLLIHGGGSTIETNWEQLIPLLTPSRQVIAVEEEGHGRTQPTDRALTSAASADDVAAVVRSLEVGPVDVLGFSAGGSTALQLALRHPEQVRRLIVASSFAKRDAMIDGFWEGLAGGSLADMPALYQEADLALNNGDRDHLQRLFDLDSRRMLDSTDVPDEQLGALAAPTLILLGDRDVVTVEGALRLVRALPDARLLVVPGNHGDYLGERGATGGGPGSVRLTVPHLLAFLDA